VKSGRRISPLFFARRRQFFPFRRICWFLFVDEPAPPLPPSTGLLCPKLPSLKLFSFPAWGLVLPAPLSPFFPDSRADAPFFFFAQQMPSLFSHRRVFLFVEPLFYTGILLHSRRSFSSFRTVTVLFLSPSPARLMGIPVVSFPLYKAARISFFPYAAENPSPPFSSEMASQSFSSRRYRRGPPASFLLFTKQLLLFSLSSKAELPPLRLNPPVTPLRGLCRFAEIPWKLSINLRAPHNIDRPFFFSGAAIGGCLFRANLFLARSTGYILPFFR